jgi:hypothetical protein
VSAEHADCASASRYGSGLFARRSSTAFSALYDVRQGPSRRRCGRADLESNPLCSNLVVAENEVGEDLDELRADLIRHLDVHAGLMFHEGRMKESGVKERR